MALDDLVKLIKNPAIEYRPELRWWLAEGLHTDETLRFEIDAAHRLGFGGMEFLAMDEGAIDHARYGWGAEEWVHDSQIVAEETTKRNMSVSFTSGTNWSNANLPTIDADHPAAAKELDVVVEDLAAGGSRTGPLTRIDLAAELAPGHHLPGVRGEIRDQVLVAVIAIRALEETATGAILDVDSVVDLTGQVTNEALDWTAPDDGSWRLFTYWMHGTGQTASPSASVNYTVSYVDPDGAQAVIDYWDSVVLTPGAPGADRPEPPRSDVYGLARAVDLRRRRPVLGPHGGRGVPKSARLRHRAVAALPHPDGDDDGGRHHLSPRAPRKCIGSRSKRSASTTYAPSPISTSRTCCARSPASCTTTA